MLRPLSFRYLDADGSETVLRLSSSVGLIGANDVGKTRLLAQLYRAGAAVEYATAGTARDLPSALRHEAHQVQLACKCTGPHLSRALDTGTHAELVEAVLAGLPDRRSGEEHAAGRRLAEHILADPIVIIGAESLDATTLDVPISLAIGASFGDLPENVRDDMAKCGRTIPSRWPTDVPFPLLPLRAQPELLRRLEVPRTVWLPASGSTVQQRVEEAIAEFLRAGVLALDAQYQGHLEPFGFPGLSNPERAVWADGLETRLLDPWLIPVVNPYTGQDSVNPFLVGAARLLSTIAERLTAPFVTDRYAVSVDVTPLSLWIRGDRRVWPALVDRNRQIRFEAEAIAEGFRLWLQLGLLDACNILERLAKWIQESLEPSERSAHGIQGLAPWHEDVKHLIPPLFGMLETTTGAPLRDPLATVTTLVSASHPYAGDAPALEAVAGDEWTIYVLDEPERHLHPRLQREAAAWIAARAFGGASDFVFASHAIPFFGMPAPAHYVHIWRDDSGRRHLAALEPSELSAADATAEALGLDRGELLGLVAQVLFVEGITDQAFLEGLYGPELRRNGVVIVALEGATRAGSVIPMTTLLLKYTSASASVLLDDLAAEQYERLVSDSAYRRAATRDRQVELRELARVVQAATELEREVRPLGIPVKDIFDLISDGVVRDELADLTREPFPGHVAARASLGDQKWKPLYAARYGLDILDPETFRRGGAAMRARGIRSVLLDQLLRIWVSG